MPGVLRVFTGEDFEDVGGMPCGWQVTDRFGQPMQEPKHPVLAEGKVRHVGDPIAAVVAETLAQARDAAEAIELDIEELPAVVDMRAALDAGRAEGARRARRSNLCFDWGFIEDNTRRGRRGDRGRARTSPRSSSSTTGWCRTRWSRARRSASTTPADDEYTLCTTSQNPHVIRLLMGAFVLGIPEHKLRVVAPGRRRRLRLEDLPLRRGGLRHLRRQGASAGR